MAGLDSGPRLVAAGRAAADRFAEVELKPAELCDTVTAWVAAESGGFRPRPAGARLAAAAAGAGRRARRAHAGAGAGAAAGLTADCPFGRPVGLARRDEASVR